jgi:hypothetical protein
LVQVKYPADIDLGLKQAKGVDRVIVEQLESNNYTLLVDLTDSYGVMTKEAQQFFAKDAPSTPQITASAIIVNNLPIRILVKFYLNFYKPHYPTQIFPTASPAKEWLEGFIENNSDQALNAG